MHFPNRIIRDNKLFVKFLLDFLYHPGRGIGLSLCEELYQMLPIRGSVDEADPDWASLMMRADIFETHLGVIRMLEDFFDITDMSLWEVERASTSRERRELFVWNILQCGLAKWRPGHEYNRVPGKYVLTIKGTEYWWSLILSNLKFVCDAIGGGEGFEWEKIAISHLVEFLLDNEFYQASTGGSLLVDSWRVEEVIERLSEMANMRIGDIMRERLFCYDWSPTGLRRWSQILAHAFCKDECMEIIELLEIRNLIESLVLSARTAVSAAVSGGLFDMISAKLGTGGGWSKKRLSELFAMSVHSGEYQQLSSLTCLHACISRGKNMAIFRKIFVFNHLAYLDTEKVQKLCKSLHVVERSAEYACVLHYAALAYIAVGETGGAISIAERLVKDYQYPDAWRIVAQLVTKTDVPKELVSHAIRECPVEELEGMMSTMKERMHYENMQVPTEPPPKFNPIKAFPNLADDDEVEDFISHIGGDSVGLSFGNAKFLAKITSLSRDDYGTLSVLDGMRKSMIRVG